MKRRLAAILFAVVIAQVSISSAQGNKSKSFPRSARSHVLLVVAHPDDESEMAATVYRITKELSGVVDQVIISDGEGGFRYSSLAGQYYGADLANEQIGRALLPRIRQGEARRSARVLGIRHLWFLNERDDHFTLNADEVLQKTWKSARVEEWLVQRLRRGHYDVMFILLPTEDTHGEHKAASILALRAVQQLPENGRPAVLGVQASPKETEPYTALSGYPITATNSSESQFHFDRDTHFGFKDSLSYQIIVDWVIAEHKSQGLFQTTVGQNRFENFWIFAGGANNSNRTASSLFAMIVPRPPSGEPVGRVVTAK